MHEVSLMEQALALAEDYARQNGAAQIRSLTLTVGEQSGVVPEALRFAFEVVAADTLAQGAELIIRSAPVVCHCQPCDQSFQPQSWVYRCPHCGALSSEVISGKELELTSLEIEQ
jgi:hydrogenase nickel incorporation protein HypA/HybF